MSGAEEIVTQRIVYIAGRAPRQEEE